MLEWLTVFSAFWIVACLYLGGMSVDLRGGSGFRQTVGLIVVLALFLVLWGVLHALLGGGIVRGVILPLAISVLAFPLLVRIGYLPFGVRVVRADEAH